MIAFLLLFALGFLTAALIALLAAPVVHRRIVMLTERRIQASTPLSAAEIRAEKDFVRASFAAENARLAVELRDERGRSSLRAAKVAKVEGVLAESRENVLRLEQAMTDADENLGAMRSSLRDRDSRIETLQGDMSTARREASERQAEISRLNHQIVRLEGDISENRIDIATQSTEIENFKTQIQSLRDERTGLREELRGRVTAAREAELQFRREKGRADGLDERLARAQAELSDREQQLENRNKMIDELKAKHSNALAEAKESAKALQAANTQIKKYERELNKLGAANAVAVKQPAKVPVKKIAPQAPASSVVSLPKSVDATEVKALIDKLRQRQAAITEKLKVAKPKDDAALRKEIGEIAALMVELTARREGDLSEILRMLDVDKMKAGDNPGGATGLAAQALARLQQAAE